MVILKGRVTSDAPPLTGAEIDAELATLERALVETEERERQEEAEREERDRVETAHAAPRPKQKRSYALLWRLSQTQMQRVQLRSRKRRYCSDYSGGHMRRRSGVGGPPTSRAGPQR
ncbi:MAG: hypothetical protein WEF86_14960 [Gemmatimonadota bacterium]